MLRFHCLLSLHVMIGNCFLGDLLAAALGSATHSSVGTTVRTSCLWIRPFGESIGEGEGFLKRKSRRAGSWDFSGCQNS